MMPWDEASDLRLKCRITSWIFQWTRFPLKLYEMPGLSKKNRLKIASWLIHYIKYIYDLYVNFILAVSYLHVANRVECKLGFLVYHSDAYRFAVQELSWATTYLIFYDMKNVLKKSQNCFSYILANYHNSENWMFRIFRGAFPYFLPNRKKLRSLWFADACELKDQIQFYQFLHILHPPPPCWVMFNLISYQPKLFGVEGFQIWSHILQHRDFCGTERLREISNCDPPK